MIFEEFTNSLINETCFASGKKMKYEDGRNKTEISTEQSAFLGNISSLYIYTNTPPHGFGTQAPKVAETVNRAYGFNKKVVNKTITLMGVAIERMHWELEDGEFPHDEIHGNFLASELRIMVESFLQKNVTQIDSCASMTIKKALQTNSDVLTKGRQSMCAFTGKSVTAALAYRRMFDFYRENTGMQCFSCIEWIQTYFSLMNKQELVLLENTEREVKVRQYSKERRQKVWMSKRITGTHKAKIKGNDEVRKKMIQLSTRFVSYLKHKERGKKDRRAIASANMILRMFLHIIEEFHLELSRHIEGATISIGGEEKKSKISNNMSVSSLSSGPTNTGCQGTEDATKWNECLAPSAFAMMHKYLFEKETRMRLGLPPPDEFCQLFSHIAVAGNFLMSMKEIQLGSGVTICSENEMGRLQWKEEWEKCMNENTKKWFRESKERIDEKGEFMKASPGMLMGMMNAGSTTLGLLATNHRMNKDNMKVMTLRSSDDSMSSYMGITAKALASCVKMNRLNLSMIGINLSPDKTFFFREGLGEYTSWYMDRKFVSQFGVETASLRPQGKNPQDDFYSLAKGTATALQTLTINPYGATGRIRIGADAVRRLWRINIDPGKRENISGSVQLMADGGNNMWNFANCHLEETCLKKHFARTEEEKDYLLRIRNPENPFAPNIKEELVYSKEHGMLILDEVETPRTCFNFLKRSNRTFKEGENKRQEEVEKTSEEAAKIINLIDPTTMISYPTSQSFASEHLSSVLEVDASTLVLDEEESGMLQRAIRILRDGEIDLLECNIAKNEYSIYDSDDE